MAPLIVLFAATLLARLLGRFGVVSLRHWPAAARVGLAVMFGFTAVAHFNSMRVDLVAMVPPFVPAPEVISASRAFARSWAASDCWCRARAALPLLR